MHAYLITAKPSRWQRAAHGARVCAVRTAAVTGMTVLGLLVLACRLPRPVINLLAKGATHLELWVSLRLDLPPLGSLSGAALAREFGREFANAWTKPTEKGSRPS